MHEFIYSYIWFYHQYKSTIMFNLSFTGNFHIHTGNFHISFPYTAYFVKLSGTVPNFVAIFSTVKIISVLHESSSWGIQI